MEINQYDNTMATHYDITIGNDVTKDTHCEITIGNGIARDIHCDITISNDLAMYTYHGITMHNDITINLFYYVFSALYLIMILLWVVWNKNKNNFMFSVCHGKLGHTDFCTLYKFPKSYTKWSFRITDMHIQ